MLIKRCEYGHVHVFSLIAVFCCQPGVFLTGFSQAPFSIFNWSTVTQAKQQQEAVRLDGKAKVYSQDSFFIGRVKNYGAFQSFFLYKDSHFSPPLEERWAENTDELYPLLSPVFCAFPTFEGWLIADAVT